MGKLKNVGLMLVIFAVQQCLGIATEVPFPGPVVQNIPADCSRISDCPDYLGPKSWNRYQEECCRLQNGPKYHCQQTYVDEDGSHTNIVVACVYPKTCAAGTYAYVKSWAEGGRKYADIECRPCTHDRFQPNAQESFLFRYANCTRVWQKCLQEDGFGLVRAGNATHDNLCRCWWEGGYRPVWNTSKCRSREGFDQNECQCEPSPSCPDGQVLNRDFVCVPQPSNPTTTQGPPTQKLTTTDKQRVSGDAATITASPCQLLFFTLAAVVSFCCI